MLRSGWLERLFIPASPGWMRVAVIACWVGITLAVQGGRWAVEPPASWVTVELRLLALSVLQISLLVFVAGGTALIFVWMFLPKDLERASWRLLGASALCLLSAAVSLQYTQKSHAVAAVEAKQRVYLDGDVLHIDGAIAPSLPLAVDAAIRELGRLPTAVDFGRNEGGQVVAALLTHDLLRHVPEVRVSGRCSSSCAYLALLIGRPLLLPNGRLGFHRTRDILTGEDAFERPESLQLYFRLAEAGYGRQQVEEMFSTDDLVFPPPATMSARGLIKQCVSHDLQVERCGDRPQYPEQI